MKFDRFDYLISCYPFYILPTIIIVVNDMILLQENISIEFRWLNLHCRWRWMKEQKCME